MTLVCELMSAAPQRCLVSQSLNDAANLMWEHDCGCVPVVDERNHVVGMLTDRDVCIGAYSQGKPLREIPVSTVCSTDVKTCKANDSIDHAQACTGASGEDYAIDGENAIVLQRNDPNEFFSLFTRLQQQPERRHALRRSGMSTARRYAWSRVIERSLLPRI